MLLIKKEKSSALEDFFLISHTEIHASLTLPRNVVNQVKKDGLHFLRFHIGIHNRIYSSSDYM